MIYDRPGEQYVSVERRSVDGTCPNCLTTDLSAETVLSEGGWHNVVKCRQCLHSVRREPDPAGPVDLLSRGV